MQPQFYSALDSARESQGSDRLGNFTSDGDEQFSPAIGGFSLQTLAANNVQFTANITPHRSDAVVSDFISNVDELHTSVQGPEHKIEELTLQIAALSQHPVAPSNEKPLIYRFDRSGSVSRSLLDQDTRTSSTRPAPSSYDVTSPSNAKLQDVMVEVDPWQTKLSKRDKKAAAAAAPALAETVPPYPFLRAVTIGAEEACTQQSRCRCSCRFTSNSPKTPSPGKASPYISPPAAA